MCIIYTVILISKLIPPSLKLKMMGAVFPKQKKKTTFSEIFKMTKIFVPNYKTNLQILTSKN
jgi:hypothetical protein